MRQPSESVRDDTAQLASLALSDLHEKANRRLSFPTETFVRPQSAAKPSPALRPASPKSELRSSPQAIAELAEPSTPTHSRNEDTEETPLLPSPAKAIPSDLEGQPISQARWRISITRFSWKDAPWAVVRVLPAVMLGLLLNVLDALSYGMILFPLNDPIFESLGPDGISMFYVSCIISQLVFSAGGSVFKGGIGSEMIEIVPFYHGFIKTIIREVGTDSPETVLATTVVAFALSAILTGIVFFLMGQCHLGSLIGFFPRHILIGCIGGVGLFLLATGFEVSARLDGSFEYNIHTIRILLQTSTVPLWVIPLSLAVLLLLIKTRVKHSLTDATFFLLIILGFYLVEWAAADLTIPKLRHGGWIFDAPRSNSPWYHFYTLYNFQLVSGKALAATIPAMLALTFFALLHVPINIPALGLTLQFDEVDVDRELRAHGISNALSGLCGSVQNYLVYTNTVLFIRSGGDSRLAGLLLAVATTAVLLAGPALIGYIPVMVVGALIFFLGIDLLREALWSTLGKANRLEYLTVSSMFVWTCLSSIFLSV